MSCCGGCCEAALEGFSASGRDGVHGLESGAVTSVAPLVRVGKPRRLASQGKDIVLCLGVEGVLCGQRLVGFRRASVILLCPLQAR
jgi:hypothetical protein